MHAVIWMQTNTNAYCALWGVIFNRKSHLIQWLRDWDMTLYGFQNLFLSIQEPLGDHREINHVSIGHSWPHWMFCCCWMWNFRKAFFKTFLNNEKSDLLSNFFSFWPTIFSSFKSKKIAVKILVFFGHLKKELKQKSPYKSI